MATNQISTIPSLEEIPHLDEICRLAKRIDDHYGESIDGEEADLSEPVIAVCRNWNVCDMIQKVMPELEHYYGYECQC